MKLPGLVTRREAEVKLFTGALAIWNNKGSHWGMIPVAFFWVRKRIGLRGYPGIFGIHGIQNRPKTSENSRKGRFLRNSSVACKY